MDRLDDDEVRALLASLHTDEPMPADVAARLDAVLGHETPLPAAPHGRRTRRLGLVAAAAVACVAASFSATYLLSTPSSTGDQRSAAGRATASQGRASALDNDNEAGASDVGSLPVLHSATLQADATRVVSELARRGRILAGNLDAAAAQAPSPVPSQGATSDSSARTLQQANACGIPRSHDLFQPVVYDGSAALMSIAPDPSAHTATVRIYRCQKLLATATVPLK